MEASDVENPTPSTANAVVTNPYDSAFRSDTKRKIHLALLSTFLVVVFVLSIGLGIGLQGDPSNNVDNGEGGEEGKLLHLTTGRYIIITIC